MSFLISVTILNNLEKILKLIPVKKFQFELNMLATRISKTGISTREVIFCALHLLLHGYLLNL